MEEMLKEILVIVKEIEKRMDRMEETSDRTDERTIYIRYQELANKIEELINENRIDHEYYEIKFNKLEAGQKYLELKTDEIIAQKAG